MSTALTAATARAWSVDRRHRDWSTAPRGVAFLCTLPGCSACAAFDAEERAAYETTQLQGVHAVVEWDCSLPHCKRLALVAGISDLPAYIVIPTDATLRIQTP